MMSPVRPPISAILPVRNGIRWIRESLDQIDSMLTKEDELLIINDGSTDGTTDFLLTRKLHRKQRVLDNKAGGLVSALNLGLKFATRDWIARFDVDDKYDSNRLEVMMSNINSETVAIFSDFDVIGEDIGSLGTFYCALWNLPMKLSLPRSERNAHPSVIFRRSSAIQVGGYLSEDYPCEDLSLWLRLAQVGEFQGVASPLLHYTLHGNSVSSRHYALIKSKTMDLVKRYYDPRITRDSFAHLDYTLDSYQDCPQSIERQLLHLRDFQQPQIWRTLNSSQKMKILHQILRRLTKPRYAKIAIKLMNEQFLRRRYRKINQKENTFGKSL